MNKRSLLFAGLLIFSASFILRFEYVISTEVINPVRADAKQYLQYGQNLFEHGVYSKQQTEKDVTPTPDSYRSPGYPALIAACFFIGGEENFYPLLLLLQVLLSSIVPVITLFLATYLLNTPWAIFTSFLVSLSPHHVSMTSYILTETLFSFLLIFSIFVYIEAHRNKNFTFFMFASILWGFTYLTNETALFIPFILGLISFILIRNKKYSEHVKLRWVIVFITIFCLFPTSWMIRNNIVATSDVPQGSSRALRTITHGSYIDFIYNTDKYKYFPYYEDPEQPDIGNSVPKFLKVMKKRFMERPVEYIIWYSVKKPYYLWSWNILQGQGDIYVYPIKYSLYSQNKFFDGTRIILKSIHPVMMIFFLIGLLMIIFKLFNNHILTTTQRLIFSIIGLLPIYYTFLYMIFAPWPRYAIPLRPFFFIVAVLAISEIILFCKSSSSKNKT